MTDTNTLTEDGMTQRYLDAEAAAQRLVAGLERLDEQSRNYSAAAVELSSAAEATRELISTVEEVGNAARSALEVVASVGGPEVLREVGATKASLEVAQEKVDAVASGVTANCVGIKGVAERIEAIGRRLEIVLYVAGVSAVLGLVAIVLNLIR